MKRKTLTYAGWSFIWLLILYFIFNNALQYFNPSFPVYTPEFRPFAPLLILHIIGGMTALLTGPFQFYTRLRTKHPQVHKIMGKIYLLAILVAGTTAAYLSVFDNILQKHEFTFGTGVFGLAMAWFITSGMAFYAIKNKNVLQHKEWMLRSYVVTFGFVTFRIISYSLLSIERFPYPNELGGVAGWACWSVPLLLTEWGIQLKKIKPATTKKTRPLSREFSVYTNRFGSMVADPTKPQQ